MPGFRDFAPQDLALRNGIFDAWRSAARRYGFREYDGPPLEPLELYVEKSGPEIAAQLYEFQDKGGRQVALRPEMTPTLARMLAERSRGMAKPVRWFSVPQLFRYERSQRGRLREHFQLNADIVGEADVSADVEVLALAVDAVRALGLGQADFAARVNDRRLVTAVLDAVGVPPEGRRGCLAVLDKAGRAPAEHSRERLQELGVDGRAADAIMELAASDAGQDAWERLELRFGREAGVREAMAPLERHRELVDAMGLGSFVGFDFGIVRGLDYYTGIVFELFDRAGKFRAICGGGRYDRLLELVGGDPLPAVGFGMGDVVLGELLRDRGLAPQGGAECDYFVVWVEPTQQAAALKVARELREAGHSVLYGLRSLGVGKQLKAAARAGAARAVVIGPEELASGLATVRDMRTGEQESRPMNAVAPDSALSASDSAVVLPDSAASASDPALPGTSGASR